MESVGFGSQLGSGLRVGITDQISGWDPDFESRPSYALCYRAKGEGVLRSKWSRMMEG